MNKPNKTELEYFIRYSLDSDKYKRYMELYEEIERLNKENKELDKVCARKSHYIDKKDLEIGRLNNIINEIEDSIVGKINVLYQVENQVNAIQELNILLRRLRELKGVDKE